MLQGVVVHSIRGGGGGHWNLSFSTLWWCIKEGDSSRHQLELCISKIAKQRQSFLLWFMVLILYLLIYH